MPCDHLPASHLDFAQKRLHVGVTLYYKVLESIVVEEKKKLNKRTPGQSVDLSVSGVYYLDVYERFIALDWLAKSCHLPF